jgi:hypothetical protein
MDTEEPPHPPNPELLNRQPKWFKPVFYGAIIASVLFAIVVFTTPLIFRSHHHFPGQREVNDARQIALALLEFDTEFGAYPNAATAAEVTKHYPSHGLDLSGCSSNALFRQFFAIQITQSESMFRADILGSVRPDGKIAPPGEALKKGEVGFSYISVLSSKDDPLTPIVLTPLIPGTTKFDPKPFNGKAVILHIDNSVRTYDIAKDGHIYDAKGINLLSPKHPVWKGKAPDIRYPEL